MCLWFRFWRRWRCLFYIRFVTSTTRQVERSIALNWIQKLCCHSTWPLSWTLYRSRCALPGLVSSSLDNSKKIYILGYWCGQLKSRIEISLKTKTTLSSKQTVYRSRCALPGLLLSALDNCQKSLYSWLLVWPIKITNWNQSQDQSSC